MANVQLTYGSLYWSTTSATTLSANTPAKAAGTTTEMDSSGFTHTNNRLTYTGATTLAFHVMSTISMTSSGATNSEVHLYKNGSLITGSTVSRKISTGGDVGAIACSAIIQLATNDYVEIWLENDDGDSMTIEAGVLSAKVVG